MNTWGHVRKYTARPWLLIALLFVWMPPMGVFAMDGYTYSDGRELYKYTLAKTGENFSFEFAKNPGKQEERLKAAVHVLQTVYDDGSVDPRHAAFFTKEGAKCFVFGGTFYSYTSCFLPNDYSPGNKDRFWGFVTRVPNGLWLITRNLLPALLILGGFAYFMLRRKASSVPENQASANHPAL